MVARLVRYGPVRQKKTFLHVGPKLAPRGVERGSHVTNFFDATKLMNAVVPGMHPARAIPN